MGHELKSGGNVTSRFQGPLSDAALLENGLAWNVFRRKDESDLWCAVPAERALPNFLFSGEWAHGGVSVPPASGFPDLTHPYADWAVRLNGFYLFMSFWPETRSANAAA